MPNYDTHTAALKAGTLTAAAILTDTSLALHEQLALLTQLGMRENRATPVVKTASVDLISPLTTGTTDWSLSESGGSPFTDKLQSVKATILENSESLAVSTTVDGGTPTTDKTVGTFLDVKCSQGERLTAEFAVSLPAHTSTASKVRVTYTFIEA